MNLAWFQSQPYPWVSILSKSTRSFNICGYMKCAGTAIYLRLELDISTNLIGFQDVNAWLDVSIKGEWLRYKPRNSQISCRLRNKVESTLKLPDPEEDPFVYARCTLKLP